MEQFAQLGRVAKLAAAPKANLYAEISNFGRPELVRRARDADDQKIARLTWSARKLAMGPKRRESSGA